MNKLQNVGCRIKTLAYCGVGALVASPAFAVFDTGDIDDATADMKLIGAAVFTLIVAIKVFKWARRAL